MNRVNLLIFFFGIYSKTNFFSFRKNEEEKRLYARQISECEQVISKLVNDSIKK
jgi:hypothetical protein